MEIRLNPGIILFHPNSYNQKMEEKIWIIVKILTHHKIWIKFSTLITIKQEVPEMINAAI